MMARSLADFRLYALFFLCLGIVAAPSLGKTDKLIKILLSKKVSLQNGHLGQPLTSYYAKVDIGTPAKSFNMLVDVNAREIWVPHYSRLGVVCKRLNYKNGYAKQTSSSGLKEPNEVYKIDYKGCILSGKAYKDAFQLVDIKDSTQAVKWQQRFLAMSSASNDKFAKFGGVDGVLAFNPWPISETGSDLISVGLARANLIGELVFGLTLDADLNTEVGGEMTFGGIDPLKINYGYTFHSAISQHTWEINLNNVMLGSASIGGCSDPNSGSSGCTAVLSTTSNDIFGPTKAIQSMLKLLGFEDAEDNFKANELYEIDCLRVANAPPLSIVVQGNLYVLPPSSYIRKKVGGRIVKSSSCYIALLSNGSHNRWELGTYFLSHFYTIFDINQRKVAFSVLR